MADDLLLLHLPPGIAAGLPGVPVAEVFPGHLAQVRRARRFAARVLAGHLACGAAVAIVSELAANAVLHSRSGEGGTFEVAVWRGGAAACVAVTDGGGVTEPRQLSQDALRESGRGLAIVDSLASCWGYVDDGGRRSTWSVIACPAGSPPS